MKVMQKLNSSAYEFFQKLRGVIGLTFFVSSKIEKVYLVISLIYQKRQKSLKSIIF